MRLFGWFRRKPRPQGDPFLMAWLLEGIKQGQEHWARHGEPPPPRRLEIRRPPEQEDE